MNRFQRGDGNVLPNETEICVQGAVKIYDGNEKTNFEKGNLILTSFRILWRDQLQFSNINELSLSLELVSSVEEQGGGWNKSPKILVNLNAANEKVRGVFQSPFSFIKFSFRDGGHTQFYRKLKEVLDKKQWDSLPTAAPKFRPGIMGIERQIQVRNNMADKNISAAFEDLSRLMEMAKDMVGMAKNICRKIADKQGDLTDDETRTLKSQLLSLGISDPVTRRGHGTENTFFAKLSQQLSDFLFKLVEDSGGVLSLVDVYCHVNRARGLELLSPEDLLHACGMFTDLNLPLRLHMYDSGVKVVELASNNSSQSSQLILLMLEERGSLTPDELAVILSTSVSLGKERLLTALMLGLACLDDSMEGLKFYPNFFLTREVEDI